MSNYFLAELSLSEKHGKIARFKDLKSAREWSQAELEFDPKVSGPCFIFEVNSRNQKTRLAYGILRKNGEIVQEKHREDFK